MEIFEHIAPLQEKTQDFRNRDKSIGFVPTMGALHAGHLSLVKYSIKQNDTTVVSIFINPDQFNDKDDFMNYPKTLESDLKMLRQLSCDIVFVPGEKEIYPKPDNRTFDFNGLDTVMEGKFRPGHFNGVAKVVVRLLDIVKPHRAYFGYKDFQQLVIIRHVINQLKIPVEIVPCPIIREENGLAMSSRNLRLDEAERSLAINISRVLFHVRDKYHQFESVGEVKEYVLHQLSDIHHIKVEYFDIVDEKNLQPVTSLRTPARKVGCIAAWIGSVRLIDNVNINS